MDIEGYFCEILKTIHPVKYIPAPNSRTALKPNTELINIQSIAPITVAQAFIPHAQGLSSGRKLSTWRNPAGKGIPIRTAKGLTMPAAVSARIG